MIWWRSELIDRWMSELVGCSRIGGLVGGLVGNLMGKSVGWWVNL